jgi:Flp pilus assembly protein TadG
MRIAFMFARRVQSLRQDQEGSALVEGAVLVPILVILLVGAFDFSWYFYQQHLMSVSLRDAARYLARSWDPTDPNNQSYAKTLATTRPDGKPVVSGWSSSNIAIQIASDSNSGTLTPCGSTPCRANPCGNGTTIQVVTMCTGTTSTTQTCSSTAFTNSSFSIFDILGLTAPAFNVSHSERAICESAGPS